MKARIAVLLAFAATCFAAAQATAQQRRASPHETVSAVVENNRVTLVYGRPYTKNPRTGEVRVSIGYPRRLEDYYGIVPATSLCDGLARLLQENGQAVHIPAQRIAGRRGRQ